QLSDRDLVFIECGCDRGYSQICYAESSMFRPRGRGHDVRKHRAIAYLFRRVGRIALSLVGVSIITFGLLQLVPGTFAQLQNMQLGSGLGGGGGMQSDVAGSVGEEPPAWKQYLVFMGGAITGNMG